MESLDFVLLPKIQDSFLSNQPEVATILRDTTLTIKIEIHCISQQQQQQQQKHDNIFEQRYQMTILISF